MENNVRVIAFYLPQFHPVTENNEWWGEGFTEWTNVGRAKRLFRNHYQPRIPKDLGYYDLRLPETREAQAKMALYAGIEGFAYWHYWFAGKRILERPFNEVLESGTPSLPFCLSWANETWTGVWNNDHKRILIEQTYPGLDDYIAHFNANLKAFSDSRYIKIDGKLLFIIYKPFDLPNAKEFFDCWQELAVKNGLPGFHFVGVTRKPQEIDLALNLGFDSINYVGIVHAKQSVSKIKNYYVSGMGKYFNGVLGLSIWNYKSIIKHWVTKDCFKENVIPCIYPNWDNSPRSGKRAVILHGSNPQLFEKHVNDVLKTTINKKNKIVFLKSWNEWAEGNYVEPDLKFGSGYIDVLRKLLIKK